MIVLPPPPVRKMPWVKRLIAKPRITLSVELSVRPLPPPSSAPLSSMIGTPAAPSCVAVASRITVPVIVGSSLPLTLITCCPPPPIEKFAVCRPASTFAFWMNWRSEPCTVRPDASSSPSRLLVIALKLKPESMPPTLPPARVTFVTCSAVLIEPSALSEALGSRPPYSAPGMVVKVVPAALLAAPATA